MPWNVERITVDTVASWFFKSSDCFTFSAFFFMPNSLRSYLLGCHCYCRFCFHVVNWNALAHGGGKSNFLDELALCCGGLCLRHRGSQNVRVPGKIGARKADLAHG